MFGLIGKPLSHSFSKQYFEEKHGFNSKPDGFHYLNFELESLAEIRDLIVNHPHLEGFNVTIPFKSEILSYLDESGDDVKQIGSANVVKIYRNTANGSFRLSGYNTDFSGFTQALIPHLNSEIKSALILGTGGSSKAVAFALHKMGISSIQVSREANTTGLIAYDDLNERVVKNHLLIVNTTPLGMWPLVDDYPKIPIQFLSSRHLVFDLIYNPSETLLLHLAKVQGAKVVNGYEMLCRQADQSFKIWNS